MSSVDAESLIREEREEKPFRLYRLYIQQIFKACMTRNGQNENHPGVDRDYSASTPLFF